MFVPLPACARRQAEHLRSGLLVNRSLVSGLCLLSQKAKHQIYHEDPNSSLAELWDDCKTQPQILARAYGMTPLNGQRKCNLQMFAMIPGPKNDENLDCTVEAGIVM